jgi:hypothetical protein
MVDPPLWSPPKCLWLSGMPGSRNRTHQNTSEQERLTHVTIVDPRHPLFGRTFALRDFSPRGNSSVTIQLPNGQRRVVPRSVTNLDANEFSESAVGDLPIISVRTILPVARFVQAKLRATEEEKDGRSSSCVGTGSAKQPRTQWRAGSPTVDSTGPGLAKTAGAALGQDDSENATTDRTRRGGA